MRSRLGDDIDDFCVKCKRVMNHLVVSLLNDEPAKVRCRTCHGDHDFRHEQAPPPKIDARKAALIQQALEKACWRRKEHPPMPMRLPDLRRDPAKPLPEWRRPSSHVRPVEKSARAEMTGFPI